MFSSILQHAVLLWPTPDRDHGWIHTLLEEAENERMHLLTFLKLKKPGPIFRFAVMISQGVMYNAFFLSYLISPKACHRFVGYIEEEAVHTYTRVRRPPRMHHSQVGSVNTCRCRRRWLLSAFHLLGFGYVLCFAVSAG